MQATTPTRHGAKIFWLNFLAVAGVIGATVLLANDQRNLNVIVTATGVEANAMAAIPELVAVAVRKGKRLPAREIPISKRMLLTSVDSFDGAFLRSFDQQEGAKLCARLRQEGFEMSAWGRSDYAPSIFECSYDLSIGNSDTPDEGSHFFLIVKGNAAGYLLSARARIIVQNGHAKSELATRTAAALKGIALHTGWLELIDEIPKVARLKQFKVVSLGMSAQLNEEPNGPGRYNLIISATPKLNEAEQRTRQFLDSARFLPMPLAEHGIARPASWMARRSKT